VQLKCGSGGSNYYIASIIPTPSIRNAVDAMEMSPSDLGSPPDPRAAEQDDDCPDVVSWGDDPFP